MTKQILSRFFVAATLVAVMALTSCDKKDTADSLADEFIEQMNRIPKAMSSITDKATAEEAATTIGDAGDELVSIAERLKDLPEPSDEEKEKLSKKIEDGIKLGGMMGNVDVNVMRDQEIQKIIESAMTGLEAKMKKIEKEFVKLGKGPKKK